MELARKLPPMRENIVRVNDCKFHHNNFEARAYIMEWWTYGRDSVASAPCNDREHGERAHYCIPPSFAFCFPLLFPVCELLLGQVKSNGLLPLLMT
ncbi:Hypothetical protein, putative [Bodo saltans]|uniref:Uncharacterized protein n=1 Tax=Bodo saltans TaxID=75058 RepID=A0A0S4J6J1_BODSA|nr:Hypothetical protein, putative [Bodo saltans]|eukprot:CUG85562.1 Hypothetical protein, putative [Bodo saltans]